MKGFIKITQTNNGVTYINVNHIIRIARETAEECRIYLIESTVIQTNSTLDEIEKLIDYTLSS
nr:hypothetical protein [uncultured Flavobacterium sp.]